MQPKTVSALLKTSKNYTDLLRLNVLEYGFNLTEFGILEALYQKGRLTVGELLSKLLVNNSTLSYTINKLIKEELIEKKCCETDGRVFYVTLSSKGHKVISDIAPKHYAYIETIGKALDEDEEKTLRELLKKLNKGEQA